MRLRAEKSHQVDEINWEGWSHWRGLIMTTWLIFLWLHCESEYPSGREEMPVWVRCIAIGCKRCFFSFCKRVISTSGTKHFIGKKNPKTKKWRRLENGADFGMSCRAWCGREATLRGQTGEEGAGEETPTRRRRGGGTEWRWGESENNEQNDRYIMSCPVMVRFAYEIHQTSWSFGHIYYWQMQKNKQKKRKQKTRLHQSDTQKRKKKKKKAHWYTQPGNASP